MKLTLRGRLPFITIRVEHGGASIEIDNILVDTGSASTVLSADVLASIGITPSPSDPLHSLRGIGGRELVFSRHVDRLVVGETALANFEVEIGGMDYGFSIKGILGMDFLRGTRAIVDLGALTIEAGRAAK